MSTKQVLTLSVVLLAVGAGGIAYAFSRANSKAKRNSKNLSIGIV